MLQVFLVEDPEIEYLFCGAPSGSETCRAAAGVGRNTFLSSNHLCFIIVFICDLFVSRDDPLMS